MNTWAVTKVSALFHKHLCKPNKIAARQNLTKNKTRRTGSALRLASSNREKTDCLRRHIGRRDENEQINRYESLTNSVVSKRNTETFRCTVAGIDITGRVDGIVEDKQLILEHKRRVFGLLGYVPLHEQVQCHLYMRMASIYKTHVFETFGNHYNIHSLIYDPLIWEKIERALARSQTTLDDGV